MATFKFNGISALTLSEKITTPSIRLQKDGNNWYVPLFSGNKGSVVKNGDYNYTLGGLKVGNYHAAIGRELANKRPEIRLVEARRLAGNLCQIVVKVRDLDNDDLNMYIEKLINEVTSGASQQFKYVKIQESTKTITDTRDWQEVKFTVQLNNIGGYSGMEYVWRLYVSDGKSTEVMNGNIKK